jgi:hypothetical protein
LTAPRSSIFSACTASSTGLLRHAVSLNPAASVRGERYRVTENNAAEISVD